MFAERIQTIPRFYLVLLGILLFITLFGAGFFVFKTLVFQFKEGKPQRTFNELTPQEQEQVLQSVTAPESSSLSPAEEEKKLIEQGTAPSSQSSLPSEDMQRLINSLTAPGE